MKRPSWITKGMFVRTGPKEWAFTHPDGWRADCTVLPPPPWPRVGSGPLWDIVSPGEHVGGDLRKELTWLHTKWKSELTAHDLATLASEGVDVDFWHGGVQ